MEKETLPREKVRARERRRMEKETLPQEKVRARERSLQQHQSSRQNATTDNSMNLGSQVTASGNPHMQVWSPSLKSEMWQERAPTMHGRKKEWGLISQLAKGRGKKTHPLQTWKVFLPLLYMRSLIGTDIPTTV
ncbi:uncharacterized protein LOC125472360 [Pyrus x bretschneideri]|uniref:uncharacterized protein LOC125472360 n=1 Tax=Pyrus x bretschneideri TaxID=225117 RepID=UPI0020309516|nr:uncharacterized protein LOC125472360 [Pyrus x bretschneideri]